MRKVICYLLAALPLFLCLNASAQQKALNIPGIHQLVADSKSEYEAQIEARDKQASNAAKEELNKTLLVGLQEKYMLLRSRFSFLTSTINAVEIGLEAAPLVEGIVADQAVLVSLARANPLIIPMVYHSEIDLAVQAKDLIYFLIGISASIGPLNAMKPSDRKLLFDFIVAELRRLKSISAGLISGAGNAGILVGIKGSSAFSGYINTDVSLVNQIIQNSKYLKK